MATIILGYFICFIVGLLIGCISTQSEKETFMEDDEIDIEIEYLEELKRRNRKRREVRDRKRRR